MEAVPPTAPDLGGPQPVEVYIRYALSQNPDIEAARKRVDAAAYRVPQAASLDDPMVSVMGWPFYPNVPQTASGRATAKIAVSQKVPWFDKLRTQATLAEEGTNVMRAQLAAVELAVVEQVKRAYYELYFVQQAIRVTDEDRRLLLRFLPIADSRYRTGQTSQQDFLRAEVEVFNIDNQLIRLGQQLDSSQARMARLLHVSPETRIRAVAQIAHEQLPHELDRLYRQAVATRPELHAQLAAVRRDRQGVELARLAYYPDFNFVVDWAEMTTAGAMAPSADGLDDVGISMMFNVPVYRKRLRAGVREAESRVVSSAREYDSLRDQTLEEVKDLYTQAVSQYELVKLFRDDIIPKSQQTLEVSQAAYQVGDVDFLQLIDNWQQLLRFQIAYHRLESQLQQTLAALEKVVGGQLQTIVPADQIPAPLPPGNGLPVPPATPAVPPVPPTQP